jgi:hypothetical protein
MCFCGDSGAVFKTFIFFVTYKLEQLAGMLDTIRLGMVVRNKHSSLLDSFVSYDKNWGVVNVVPVFSLNTSRLEI